MVTAVFKNNNTERVRGLWQYDYGQVLRIQGLILPTAVEIDFSLQETGGESTSRVGITRDGVTDVVIPDSMLENGGATQNYSIYAFIYLTDETSGETIKKIIMSVTSRPKPEAFDAPEDAELFREAIAAVNKSAGRAETAEASAEAWAHGHADYPERDEDNAKHYADESKKDAEETKKERTAVSELAEHIDAVAMQVNEDKTDTDQYKDQASASAAKALQSEQAAKSSETAAMEAQAGAEAAEGQAELFAAQTEEDKNTVEQAKDVVMGIGQEVVENRNYVQQSVGSFGLIHQQAVTDVNNAGQTQTERVEEAGTAQVSAVQEAASEIIADREQISNNKNSIDSLKGDLTQMNKRTINVFDYSQIGTRTGITVSGYSISGKASAFATAIGTHANRIPFTCEDHTIYTVRIDVENGQESGTTGTGLSVLLCYTDETSESYSIPNDTKKTQLEAFSNGAKTLNGIMFSYGSQSNNVWTLKNIMVSVGVNSIPFIPYTSVSDDESRTLIDVGVIVESSIYKNLLDIYSIDAGRYYNGSTIVDNPDMWTSNYFPVIAGKTYKSNKPFDCVNYYSGSKALTHKNASAGQYLITPTGTDKYVRIACAGYIFNAESYIITEVMDSNDTVPEYIKNINDFSVSSGSVAYELSTGYKYGEYVIGKQDNTYSGTLELSTAGTQKLIALPISADYDGIIKKITLDIATSASFTLTLGIGQIDQRKWGLVRKTFTAYVSNGTNTIYPDEAIYKGERLFVICNSASNSASIIADTTQGIYYISTTDDSIEMIAQKGVPSLAFVIEGKRYVDSPVASANSFADLQADVSTIESEMRDKKLNNNYLISENDHYFKLIVSDSGALSTEEIIPQGKLLIMGNSYDVHDYVPGLWWGDFGMAASRKENDWKHIVLSRLLNENGMLYSFTKQTLAVWETTWQNFDYTTLDTALSDTYSCIIIRIGENNTDPDQTENQSRMSALLSYINMKTGGSVPIVVGGAVKHRTENNAAFKTAVDGVTNATWVDMESAGEITPFNAGLDYKVYGDDKKRHTISESSMAKSVAYHPNDNVQAAMANLLYPVVLEKLTE